MRHTTETAPNVVILEASHARRGFAISWIAAPLVTTALVGICLHAEVVAYLARHASEQEISKLITIVPQAIAQQTPSPMGDEAAQPKQAVESATAESQQSPQQEHDTALALATELTKAWRDVEMRLRDVETLLSERKINEAAQLKQAVERATAELRQSLQQEHDRAEALAIELAKVRQAMEQKPAAVEERPAISLPAWANSNAFLKPAQTAVQPDAATESGKSATSPGETAPLPKRVEHEPRGGNAYACQHYRTYDPASGTYMGYDGRRHSCP
ncbi:BA14K family protein [Bradyrhizobium erythrophlei]|uniref:BA14K family protein n=1 Tax=Bradyrhizobium erythrophlei TaxID=1437360 RepID=UPI0035E62A9B